MDVNNTYSFWKLINEYKINIPIIQRDYAQGRKNEEEKRLRFLTNIKEHLETNKKLHLDFVYGKIDDVFYYPIDGQQRLTTLFLIHWYFALKESGNVPKQLLNFEYDTRISSREFCKALVVHEINIPTHKGDDGFINYIHNKHWFLNSWTTDPTVQSMLVMIQSIHDLFYDISIPNVFERLTENQLITFECLNLGAKGFDLTDELYIKMNARGKQLTPFENFKANFIQLIEKYYKDQKISHPIKGEISYSGYFSYRIEKEWTDLFWDFRGDKTIIDKEFFNYFEFITQMCYFIDNINVNADSFTNHFNQYEQVYAKEEHLLFLFNSLDKLYEINNRENYSIDNFFTSLLNNEANDTNVTLFWEHSEENNLFKQIISCYSINDIDARTKIILFSILKYVVEFNIIDDNHFGMPNYLRLIRNLLQARRQKNNTRYNTNVRINEFGNYWKLFSQLLVIDPLEKLISGTINNKSTDISDQSLNNEIDKVKRPDSKNSLNKLEEFKYLGGLLHQILPVLDSNDIAATTNAIYEIWLDSNQDTINLRALIACGFEGVHIKDTKMGEAWYFGKDGNWDFILTHDDLNISKSLNELIIKYVSISGDSESRLKDIINEWLLDNEQSRNWKYYFVKYKQFLSGLNYFVWDNDFNLRLLGTEGSNPLVAYHINPYVLTVCQLVNDHSICDANDCYLQFSGTTPLKLKNGLEMYCEEEGWRIMKGSVILDNDIISKFKIEEFDIHYLLREDVKRDRIEIALDFINDLNPN